jgi:hypothetical protein
LALWNFGSGSLVLTLASINSKIISDTKTVPLKKAQNPYQSREGQGLFLKKLLLRALNLTLSREGQGLKSGSGFKSTQQLTLSKEGQRVRV